uniref:Uncharacterized protein n=2 Tax=Phyllobacteriaceae TaxID=69277 RepID=Q11KI8_CHESB
MFNSHGSMASYQTALAYNLEVASTPFSFSSDGDEQDGSKDPVAPDHDAAEREDLPYRVELWDAAKQAVVQVLAVTANASIGYAAYFAATREHPDRYITLRHKNSIVSRWNGPAH